MDKLKSIQKKLEEDPDADLTPEEKSWIVLEILTLRQLEKGYQAELADYVNTVTTMRRDFRCFSTRD